MSFLREFDELYVNLTYRCNLDCPFCSTKAGGFFNKKAVMSPEVAVAGVDVLLSNSATATPVLFFFGGEPLLQADLIRQAVEYGRRYEGEHGKRIRFIVVTNGVLLDEQMLDFAARQGVSFQVNLDGPPAVHDSLRRLPSGQGTFDRIVENLRRIEARGVGLTLRSHVPPHNPHFLETMALLESLGLSRYNLSFNLVMGLSPGSEYQWRREDFERHEERFLTFVGQYADNILERQSPVVDFFGLYGYFTAPPSEQEHYCNAGRVRLSLSPNGDVYPCFTMEDQEQFRLGNLEQGLDRFQVTRFLTLTSSSGLETEDGSDPGDVFRFLCPFQNHAVGGRVNLVPRVLQESYGAFAILVEKMKSILAHSLAETGGKGR